MGERERGLRRVTILTGGLAAVSLAGTLGVAVAAHADHVADQKATVPAGTVDSGSAGQQPNPPADQVPADDVGAGGSTGSGAASVGDEAPGTPADGNPPDQPPQEAADPPAAEGFPPVTDGGGASGQATSGGS
ncbi:hypothetical protein O7632_21900 [Solwaraspora sp. WMMD406]|uniref:hypothetical protein n=1 Tax=Solwaraspora sp. WMMD406 TaxID=3016095 RepID=UPI002416D709|nr:hypothetical protein [Solwaraspora sp. WMMD406]MDG4766730.1 hypothetical protein [Solwaraspora sp. WMMD406]